MPFKSEEQRAAMHINAPKIAQRWEKKYENTDLTTATLKQIVEEEFEKFLSEKEVSRSEQEKIAKRHKKDTAKKGAERIEKADQHFSKSASDAETQMTAHNCVVGVTMQDREKAGKTGEELDKPLTKSEQSKGWPICTKTSQIKGAPADKPEDYDKGSECARVGGKTPTHC